MRREEDAEYVALVQARSLALRRIAFLVLGDWHEAEDVVQASLLKLYRVWGRVRGAGNSAGNPEAYLRRTVIRASLDQLRGRRRRRELLPGLLPDVMAVPPAGVGESEQVMRALGRVPARQRAVLVLRYYEDQSVEETARLLGCAVGTVKSQAARGLAALRAEFAREVAAEPEDTWTRTERKVVEVVDVVADEREG